MKFSDLGKFVSVNELLIDDYAVSYDFYFMATILTLRHNAHQNGLQCEQLEDDLFEIKTTLNQLYELLDRQYTTDSIAHKLGVLHLEGMISLRNCIHTDRIDEEFSFYVRHSEENLNKYKCVFVFDFARYFESTYFAGCCSRVAILLSILCSRHFHETLNTMPISKNYLQKFMSTTQFNTSVKILLANNLIEKHRSYFNGVKKTYYTINEENVLSIIEEYEVFLTSRFIK